MTRLLLTRLGELGLDPAHIVGQGYARNVSGKVCSVQAHIAAQFPAVSGTGFLGSQEKAGLRTETRRL